jgi:hypothetical protein
MSLATNFLTSNYLSAKLIEPGLKIDAVIVSAGPVEFEDSGETKLVLRLDYQGKGLVLNQTRLKQCIAAWGPSYANWIGEKLTIWRGKDKFGGEPVDAVAIEPITEGRIAAKPALHTITSGLSGSSGSSSRYPERPSQRGQWSASEPPPIASSAGDGPGEAGPDDDVPF